MICCIECFKDKEIKSIIESLNKKGDCTTCGSKSVFIYDTDDDVLLADEFDQLLNIYVPVSILPNDYPKEKLNLLKDELYNNWNIFNIEKDMIYRLTTNICKEKYENTPEIFDSTVGIPEITQENYLVENSLLKTYNWEDFVLAIKTDNRFHTNYVNTKVLELLCTYVDKLYKKGKIFYRARISSKKGFGVRDMGAPPVGQATAGRVNSAGISCLYLASKELTTLHEIRAGAYDYVTIGKFVLKQDIHVVDLTSIDKISAFSDLDCTQHAINKIHLRKISQEIAKPLRRSDAPLDYLPTQYISDFIKSIKLGGKNQYSGIEYKSTMCRNGYNLAIFDESLFECESVYVTYIKDLTYDYD
jgi:hypothetical protein